MLMNLHSMVMYGDVCVLTPQGSDHDQMIRITNVRVVSHNNERSPAHQLVPVSGLMKAVRNGGQRGGYHSYSLSAAAAGVSAGR